LNDACPSIFKQENALFAKAQEMITKARSMTSPMEKAEQVEEAAKLFKRVGARIDLKSACKLLQSVDAYRGIIDLCISTASLKDSQNHGLYFYKNNEPSNDFAGASLFASRMECYRVLLECFQELIDRSKMTVHPNTISPSISERRTIADQLTREESANLASLLLEDSLATDDELFHVACYDWLFAHQMNDRLLQTKSPYLEDYLKRKIARSTDSAALMDLLWMFYERNCHYRAAAEILVKLAERSGSEADLNTRRQYLSRAIVCMKSQNSLSVTESAFSGEFLHELEEKMDVARVQYQLMEVLKQVPGAGQAVAELNSDLFDITQLYEKADAFSLAEQQLNIIYVANHEDPVLIENFWRRILEKEMQRSRDPNTARMALESKLTELAGIYLPSDKFFPVTLIVELIESHGPLLSEENPSWLAELLSKLSFPIPVLVDIYHGLYKTRGSKYCWPGKEAQLLGILFNLMSSCTNSTARQDRYVL